MSSSPKNKTKIKYSFDIDIPRLIKAVQKRPGLYDTASPSYRDRDKKNKLWEEVCIDVCTPDDWVGLTKSAKGEFSFEVQRKWQNLRSCYRRELLIQYKKQSGQLKTKKKRKYYYFNSLDYLRPHCQDIRLPANNQNTEGSEEPREDQEESEYFEDPLDEESDNENRSTSPSSSQNYDQFEMDIMNDIKTEHFDVNNANCSTNVDSRKITNKYLPGEFVGGNSEDDVGNNIKKHKKRKEDKCSDDGDEEFLKSLLPTMKEFTSDQKLLLRIEIMKTIVEFKKSQS